VKTRIKRLEPPDSIHLIAAEGWLGLGNHIEANEELENITPQLRAHPDVLEMRWQIYAEAKKWEACVDIARAITNLAPSLPQGWLHLAYSLRRIKGGGVQAAWEALLPMAEKFPTAWLIPYNLACYAAQMQRLHGARDWLKRAIDIAEKIGRFNEVRLMALDDLDLEQLWQEIPPPKIRQEKYL
jgi:tetratricopeptide (TPR) repeat protein